MNRPDKPTMSGTNAQRAAAFFRQPAWSRLLENVYTKYVAQGRVGGQVVLQDWTEEERREIVRFLKKRLRPGDTLTVRLSDFQRALNESGFPCELAELLAALYPERSHETRPQERQRRERARQRFYEELSGLADDLPAEAKGRRWLLQGAHGRDSLFRRYQNEERALQETLLEAVRSVIDALNQLPMQPPAPPAYERLSLFAQRISGDPHRLDAQSLAGRLFLHALQDLSELDDPQNSVQAAGEMAASSTVEQVAEEESIPAREHTQQRHLLYYEAGLLADTISSTVTTFRLAYAEDDAGQRDALIESAGSRVLVLPLRQLLAWKKLAPTGRDVYIFENPQVFEDIVDELQRRAESGDEGQRQIAPTLICTAGWPSVAAIRLLHLLIDAVPDLVLHYSGDFDLPGLRIAAYLQKRYCAHYQRWRLDPSSYHAALHQKSERFTGSDLNALQALPAPFAPLVAAMQEHGRKAYQEGITQLLLNDIRASQGEAPGPPCDHFPTESDMI